MTAVLDSDGTKRYSQTKVGRSVAVSRDLASTWRHNTFSWCRRKTISASSHANRKVNIWSCKATSELISLQIRRSHRGVRRG